MKFIVPLLSLFLIGCSTVKFPTPLKDPAAPVTEKTKPLKIIERPIVNASPLAKELKSLPALDGKVITIAVYSFLDRTGQRKSADNYASFSAAVTQGAESWLIESLQLAGNGTWFKVLERNGLDDLIKERQMYRQALEEFEDNKTAGLGPMLFAGVIAQGGIIGYDSNIETGGLGASVLGIGVSTQYRKDVITVSLRIVSTNTGEVLLSVATTKTVYSTLVNGSALAFINNGTRYGEAELGAANNEPVTIAVRAAIDAAVIEAIRQGEAKGFWKFKQP
jgi:curli production assembly/transport component CsgG